jgi:hypothetical protein
MKELPPQIISAKSLAEFQHSIARFISEFFPDSRIVIELTERSLFNLAPPMEWIPETQEVEQDPNSSEDSDLSKLSAQAIVSVLREHRPKHRANPLQVTLGDHYLVLMYPFFHGIVPIELAILCKYEVTNIQLVEINEYLDQLAIACINILQSQLKDSNSSVENVFPIISTEILKREVIAGRKSY